jgi:hypothetical protein
MNAVATIDPELDLGYPATLPLELALRIATPKKICEAYGISKTEFEVLARNPTFIDDLRRARELVRREGMSFKLKAMIQSDELLKTSWAMIHNTALPATVRADLIKFTVRVAGLDASKDQGAGGEDKPTFSITVNL